MLLSAVAMPTLPMVIQDDLVAGVLGRLSSLTHLNFDRFDSFRLNSLESLVGMLLLVSVFGAVSKLIEWRLESALVDGANLREVAEGHLIQKRLLQWSWVLFAPLCLAAIGWGGMPKKLFSSTDSMSCSLAIWMLPSVLMVTLIDSQSHRWRNWLAESIVDRGKDRELQSWICSFWSHVRHTWLSVFLMPLVACTALDLAAVGVEVWHFSRIQQLFLGILVLATIVFVAPYSMLSFWSTEPLEGVDDDRSAISLSRVAWVQEIWSKNVRNSPRVLYWATNHRLSCAMVVGWLPPLRCLVLSDALMHQLNDDQLRMVILHEAAHVRRFHVWIRFIPVLLGTLGLLVWFHPHLYHLLASNVSGYAGVLHALVTLVSMVFLLVSISWVAKWTELDADKYAINLSTMQETKATFTPKQSLSSQVTDGALSGSRQALTRQESAREMILALEKIVPVSLHGCPGWLHPSVENRRLRIVQTYFKNSLSMVESNSWVGELVSHSEVASDFRANAVTVSLPGSMEQVPAGAQ